MVGLTALNRLVLNLTARDIHKVGLNQVKVPILLTCPRTERATDLLSRQTRRGTLATNALLPSRWCIITATYFGREFAWSFYAQ